MSSKRRFYAPSLIAAAFLCAMLTCHACAQTRHYAPNANFDHQRAFEPLRSGFDLADVSSVAELHALPDGVEALIWVGMCDGLTTDFQKHISHFIGEKHVFGFYLMDDPDPRGIRGPPCASENLKAQSDWIHEHSPGARTFISLMNLGSSRAPTYQGGYNSENTNIDLFGIAPYPCRTSRDTCDLHMIDRYVSAAMEAGIPRENIVPIYQAFGGGDWITDDGARYRMPTQSELGAMLNRWRGLTPAPQFDYAYSWGVQKGDRALSQDPILQDVFRARWASPPMSMEDK